MARLFQQMGLQADMPEVGCCGMAGAFGFETGTHFDVSQTLANRHLVPAIKDAPKDMLIVADGFSCRQQISQNTDRNALHVAEVLALAGQIAADGTSLESYPERSFAEKNGHMPRSVKVCAVVAAGILLGGVAFAVANRRSAGRAS